MLFLFDSASRTLKPLTPQDGKTLKLYFCGPTVYDRLHLGNLRSLFAADLLVRVARRHHSVLFARNITDIDDKIITKARDNHENISDLTARTITQYHKDTETLGLLKPDLEPHATEYIPQMITMITRIIAHNKAYVANHHVFFDSTQHEDNVPFLREGGRSRIEHDYGQKNTSDFVLWKPSQPDEPGWDSPWGYGRPGWHIECSAMTHAIFGDQFDLHGGGSDLAFPHHANECRQCKAAYPGSHHAQHWMHSGMLVTEGKKMAKSMGNTLSLDHILATYNAETLRLLYLSAHWSQPLELSEMTLNTAHQRLKTLRAKVDPVWTETVQDPDPDTTSLLDQNLNTPQWLSALHTLEPEDLLHTGRFLGLFTEAPQKRNINHALVETLIAERNKARKNRDWAEADALRTKLDAMGVILNDNKDHTTWTQR